MWMKHSLLAVGFSALALGVPAWAQTSVERFQRQLEQIQRDTRLRANPQVPAGQRALFDYGGYVGLNFFAIDDTEQKTHVLRQYDLVGFARLNIDNAHEFFFRARTSYRDFNEGQSFDGQGDETIWPTVEQAYYRFDLARHLAAYKDTVINDNVVFQGGRQFVYWANGLVLGQTIDGGSLDLTYGKLGLQLLGGVTSHKTVDLDSSRPQFDDYTNRGFYGGMLTAQLAKHRPFVYALVQRDCNDADPLVVGAITTRFEYDSYYIGAGSTGSFGDRLVYGLEVVYEGGNTLSNSFDPGTFAPLTQTEDDIEAAAADFRLDYLLADPHRTRFSFETILATGDTDRLSSTNTFGGNRPDTSDRGFNAFGLLNTGLAFSPAVSNLASFRVGASTFPFSSGVFKRLQVGSDLFLFGKFEKDAPIDETTTNEWLLGFEPDIYVNWQITSDITFALRYGVFFPGGAIVANDHPRNFFFAGLIFAF
jgi:hypothetical protein